MRKNSQNAWSRVAKRIGTSIALAMALLASSVLTAEQQGQTEAVDIARSAPFDRITLSDNTVIQVDPVSPRPLPPINPKRPRKKSEKFVKPPEGNIGAAAEKAKAELDKENAGDDDVSIHLLAGEVRDFKVKRINIKSVEYYEDMLIKESDRLLSERQYGRAFELLLKVNQRDPKWPGIEAQSDKHLFSEGSAALLENDGERGLRLLRELALKKPDYPELADKLGSAYAARASKAFDLGLYRLGRSILHNAEPVAPGHPALKTVTNQFIARAQDDFDKAQNREAGARLDALTHALEVWPTLKGAEAAYRESFAKEPTLSVGVVDVPLGIGPWKRTPADQRVNRLLFVPLLDSDTDDAFQGKAVRPQLAGKVESTDLGRKLVVTLQTDRQWSDKSRPVSSIDLVRSLTERSNPAFPGYSARWADLLEKVDVTTENQVEIRFSRINLNPGLWLTCPIGPAHAGLDGRIPSTSEQRILVSDGPFRLNRATDRLIELQATSTIKLHRLIEHRFVDAKSMLGAFERGEVSLLAHLPADQVERLTSTDDVKIGRYQNPMLHRLELDGRNPAFRNRSLRRGISYAIDRQSLLENVVLRRPADQANLVSDGPFPKGSFADAPDVKPFTYDPLLARMLIVAAKKELGAQPLKLTFAYPAIPEVQAVVPKLIEAFRLAGLETTPRMLPESELELELRSGARFDIAYRVSPCVDPIYDTGPFLSPGYDAPASQDPLSSIASPRILQLLLQLERAPEFPTAKALLIQIDRECRDELPSLPLWQVEDHYAWRGRLNGPPEVTDELYQGIDNWEIQPWFLKDGW